MGKRLPSASSIEEYARVASSRIRAAKLLRPKRSRGSLDPLKEPPLSAAAAAASSRGGAAGRGMESRLPLAEVVGDCVRRWFQDALKEAKAGDAAMQVLVGQMYHSGYGVAKNEQKIHFYLSSVVMAHMTQDRLEHGLRKHQNTDLQFGKLVTNIQDIMLATQILMR